MVRVNKILVISNMYPSKRSKTYGIFVKNQVEQLREKGLDVDVLAINDPRRGKFHTIKKHLFWFMKAFYYFVFKGKKYDIIHSHYIFPSGWLALLFQKFYKTKIIVTSHGGDIDQMAKKGEFISRQTKNILEKADGIIAVGEQLKQEMIEQFSVKTEKITVLNMGVNRRVFKPQSKQKAKQELNLDEQRKHILFVGNIIRAKGVLELLEAHKHLQEQFSNLSLHIIGSVADSSFKEQVDQKINDEKISNVYIYNPMSQEQLALWMSAADLFVLPSHIEGFGLVALEAMSTNTPVVGTKVGGLKYLLKDGHGILVEPENAKSLTEGIKQVLTDDKLQQKLITKGEQRAEQNSQEVIISQLIALYDKV